jgi:hypothetical protein
MHCFLLDGQIKIIPWFFLRDDWNIKPLLRDSFVFAILSESFADFPSKVASKFP